MDNKRLDFIMDQFNEEYEKHKIEVFEHKTLQEMLAMYARYCGRLEALLMAIDIERR